jgi:hypothetical protein
MEGRDLIAEVKDCKFVPSDLYVEALEFHVDRGLAIFFRG